MVLVVFARRLRDGMTYEDFERAWKAERGFGVPARVFTAVDVSDPRVVLTVGFVDVEAEELAARGAEVEEQEGVRHGRIDEVIESTELRAFYALGGEYDFSAEPREIPIGSPESLLFGLAA